MNSLLCSKFNLNIFSLCYKLVCLLLKAFTNYLLKVLYIQARQIAFLKYCDLNNSTRLSWTHHISWRDQQLSKRKKTAV